MRKDLYTHERGAVLVEYAVAIGILLVVFAAAGVYLIASTNKRAARSIESVSRDIPCLNPTLFQENDNKLNWENGECE